MELQGKSFSVLDMNFVSVSSFLAVFPFLHLGVEIITLGHCFFIFFIFIFGRVQLIFYFAGIES